MNIAEVKAYLSALTSHVTFEYNGFNCGIDPLGRNKFDMWYGKNYTMAFSIEDVMSKKFFDGKSLEEIWNDIVELDY